MRTVIMKAIVSGAAGFIASHLCDLLLSEGHEVIGIDDLSTGLEKNLPVHQNFTFQKGDICEDRLAFGKADWFFHLAAKADIVPSIENPMAYHKANVTGTVAALELARSLQVKRFMYAASSSCYGIPTNYPTGEAAKINPQYPYAFTKWLGEEAVLHWAKVYKMEAVSLRLFNVFGPRSRTTGSYGAVFGVFMSQLANRKPLTIVGSGNQQRDFVYVTDVARAFLKAATEPLTNNIYNIASGKPKKINYLAELLGGGIFVNLPERPGEPRKTHGRTGRAAIWLNWEPKVTFEEGVGVMRKLIPQYKDAPLWTKDSIEKATEAWFRHLS